MTISGTSEHLAKTVPLLRLRPEVGLVYHDSLGIDEEGKEVPVQHRLCPAGRVTQDLFVYDFIFTPSVVCRRKIVQQIGGFDRTMVPSEDYDLWLKMSLRCEFAFVDEPLMSRRLHPGNISQSRGRNDIIRAVLKERFWRYHGKQAGIDHQIAYGALAKAFYHAARSVWRHAGHRQSARRILRRSLHYRPLNPRALRLWAATLRRDRHVNVPDALIEVEATTGWTIGRAD